MWNWHYFNLKWSYFTLLMTQMIHGAGVFTYICRKQHLNVGKYPSPTDPSWVSGFWGLLCKSLRIFQHTPGRYPKPFTNSLWRNSFHLEVWGCLGYAPGVTLGFSKKIPRGLRHQSLRHQSDAHLCPDVTWISFSEMSENGVAYFSLGWKRNLDHPI